MMGVITYNHQKCRVDDKTPAKLFLATSRLESYCLLYF